MKYYAEDDADRYLRFRFFPDFDYRGVFVEVGAAGPEYLSMSQHFRETGWQVIPIEPNPFFCQMYRERGYEILEYAVSNFDADDVDFTIVKQNHSPVYCNGHITYESYSALTIDPSYNMNNNRCTKEIIKVKVRKLNTLLNEYYPLLNHIDALSIDVEGHELEVVEQFDFNTYNPKVIVLENILKRSTYIDCMKTYGYQLCNTLQNNQFYSKD